eukprot:5496797-Ditylum_brightwellii.AAC.1
MDNEETDDDDDDSSAENTQAPSRYQLHNRAINIVNSILLEEFPNIVTAAQKPVHQDRYVIANNFYK